MNENELREIAWALSWEAPPKYAKPDSPPHLKVSGICVHEYTDDEGNDYVEILLSRNNRYNSFVDRVRDCWSAETSVCPDKWNPANPALGQCAVTALVIQDRFGGEIMKTTVNGESHYLNKFHDGTWADATLSQFPYGSTYDYTPELADRKYIASYPNTLGRYLELRRRVFD